MKHLEVSRRIELVSPVAPSDLRKTLLDYLGKSVDIESVSEDSSRFTVRGTTGSPAGLTRYVRLDLNVHIDYREKEKTARIIISGYARAARSLIILYSFAFLTLLLVGLLPGFVETSASGSSAIDALFFLIFGIFIVYDVNSKLTTARDSLETALDSLDTTYG